ncbi:hypothetical protein BRADI_4g39269v3 [Brachypodium distachyon]|uniref:NmrA-like domain-containing protein n=1 Tax=Brachypodium distachyon TaxID=15368 RepID=A0A0Q3J030_BRADI|nr:hypothetical protein BRADI_4g39269v3 [Brachypodium distachyon]
MEKSKVLVVGGTGYIGRRIVKASLAQGHPTYVLMRPDMGFAVDKIQMILSFKAAGARVVEASVDDHRSLVDAVKKVDLVVSAMSGYQLSRQLKLVDAIKEAGNIKRFLPSEFYMDPARMEHALAPGRNTFDEKMEIRRAIEEANIPTPMFLLTALLLTLCPTSVNWVPFSLPKRKFKYMEMGTSKVWTAIAAWIRCAVFDPSGWEPNDSMKSWWLRRNETARAETSKTVGRGPTSLFLLTLWSIWKERNNCIFNLKRLPAGGVVSIIKNEAAMWSLMDTSGLGKLVSGTDDVP